MKIKITFFFTFLFSISLITPTIISLVDDSQDIAFFLDISEEEENNGKEGKESTKDLEIKIQPAENSKILLQKGIQRKKNVREKLVLGTMQDKTD